MVDDNKAWLNTMLGRMYADTDGVIKLKEVNKMRDWIAVHNDMNGDVAIIRKDSINYVSTDNETGTTVIHTNNFVYIVRESYSNIVRRIIE